MLNPYSIIIGVALGLIIPNIFVYFVIKRDERRATEQCQDRLIKQLQLDMASANTRIRKNTMLIDHLIKNYQRLEEQYERFNQTTTNKTQAD